jgi:hypothetical protein
MSKMPEMCFFCERNYYAIEELKKGLDEYDFDWRKVIRSCEAYPSGIPKAVFLSGHLYSKPDDNGLQFKGKNPFENYIMTKEEEDRIYLSVNQYIEEQLMNTEEYRLKTGQEKADRWTEDIDYIIDSEKQY